MITVCNKHCFCCVIKYFLIILVLHIQNYFRTQPDNVKSINLVQELSEFISVLYSSIDSDSIGVLTELYSTLTEISQVG